MVVHSLARARFYVGKISAVAQVGRAKECVRVQNARALARQDATILALAREKRMDAQIFGNLKLSVQLIKTLGSLFKDGKRGERGSCSA
ncbi:hypothetical protein D6817_01760 [Candidatus Pacearchaeota archaeon]|nr:MAG: hypothetical protein D6817_01760 [Candidatus Pacearchaeota archaeon]